MFNSKMITRVNLQWGKNTYDIRVLSRCRLDFYIVCISNAYLIRYNMVKM